MKLTKWTITAMAAVFAMNFTAGVAMAQRPGAGAAGGSINGGPFIPLGGPKPPQGGSFNGGPFVPLPKPPVPPPPAGGSIDGGAFVPLPPRPPRPPAPPVIPAGRARFDFYQCGRNIVAVPFGGPAPRGCRKVGDGIIDGRRVDPRTGVVAAAGLR